MRFSNIVKSTLLQFNAPQGNRIVPFLLSAPGGGKSACAREIARSLLASRGLSAVTYDSASPETIETANIVEFNAALRDPVDVLGLPSLAGDYAQWKAQAEMYVLRAGTGPKVLILEELSDATTPMQNALCRVIYDRYAGNLRLTDELFIIATGNRTEDKSGAQRIISKLAGRTRRIDYQENLDDLVEYALGAGWPLWLIQFLRFRPGLVSEFDPARFANPTPRTWEHVALIPDMPADLWLEHAKGSVGEGAAAEAAGFKRIYDDLPDIDGEVLLNPMSAKVPTDPAVRYAIAGAIARRATVDNFDRVVTYANRMPPEFGVTVVKDAMRLTPAVAKTRAFVEWATRNAAVLM